LSIDSIVPLYSSSFLFVWLQVKAAADPYAYESFVKDKIKKKIEEKRANRIVVQKRLPKVNAEFAKALLGDKQQDDEVTKNPLRDNRFAKLFADDSFRIDTLSADYQRLHPSNRDEQSAAFDQRFARVDDEDDDDEDEEEADESDRSDRDDSDDQSGDNSDDDNRHASKNRMHKVASMQRAAVEADQKKQRTMWAQAEERAVEREAARLKQMKEPAMFELKRGYNLTTNSDSKSSQVRRSTKLSFEELAQQQAESASARDDSRTRDQLPTHDSEAQRRQRRGASEVNAELRQSRDGDRGGRGGRGRGGSRGGSRGGARGGARGGFRGRGGGGFRGRGGRGH
jgi:ribosome biogenesis protein ENP2